MSTKEQDLEAYLSANSKPESQVLYELARYTNLNTFNPRMVSGHIQGKLFEMIVHMVNPKRVLEIGTFTGYSAICIASALSDSAMLDTIEVNDELEDTARTFFVKSGLSSKINLHIGSALEIVPTLPYAYQLAYIDGDKREYPNYLNLVLPKIEPGGFIIADNVLWNGKVTDKSCNDLHTKAINEFNQMITADTRVDNVLLPIRDGLMLIRKL